MLKKTLQWLFTLTGIIIGYFIGEYASKSDTIRKIGFLSGKSALIIILISLLSGLILFLISPVIYNLINKALNYFEKNIQKFSTHEIIFGTAGALVGLVVAVLIGSFFPKTPLFIMIGVILALILAAFGADIAIKKKEDLIAISANLKKGNSTKDKKSKSGTKGVTKVLDTSVIIDGRIFDICQTGFVEGTLVIPSFVLQELRHIADSSDSLKRNRGRRGLDILNKIQKELKMDVQINEKDFPDVAEVDSKLLKMAQYLNGMVITNDYNLNKVAEFQGVPVLNINELANAIKPVVLPGEEMTIQIIKDGKESNQGIAYLDDGTMIVVEGGKRHIGEVMNVIVTSVLQTAAGRMIFAKQKEGPSE